VSAEEIPNDLIFALRVYHATYYDADDVSQALSGTPISLQNELQVVQTLIDMSLDGLDRFRTSRNQDKEILQTLPQDPSETTQIRKRLAVVYRMGEKKIFNEALAIAQRALAKVKANWQYRSMEIPGENFHAKFVNPDYVVQ
jgi:hypothetical protein